MENRESYEREQQVKAELEVRGIDDSDYLEVTFTDGRIIKGIYTSEGTQGVFRLFHQNPDPKSRFPFDWFDYDYSEIKSFSKTFREDPDLAQLVEYNEFL